MIFDAFLVLFTIECGFILLYFSWKVYKRKDILGQDYFWLFLYLLALICLIQGCNYLGYIFPVLGPYPVSPQLDFLRIVLAHLCASVWFLFCLRYTGRSQYLTRINIAVLMGYTLIGAVAYQIEKIPIYSMISGYPILTDIIEAIGLSALIKSPILFILGIILLIHNYKYVSERFKHQIIILLAGVCLIILSITFFDSGIFPSFEPIGVQFGIIGIIWACGMLYYDVLTFSPVFREKFFGFVELGLVAINERHLILDMNPVAEQWLSVSLDDVFGKRLSEVVTIPEEYKDALSRPEVLENAPHIEIHVGDETRWYKISVQHDVKNLGASDVSLIVITDITRNISLEKQVFEAKAELLKEKEKIQRDHLYQEFYKSFRDAILFISNGVISDCNPEAIDLFGMSRDELIGTNPCLLSAPFQDNSYDVPDRLKYQIARASTGDLLDFPWVFVSKGRDIHTTVRLSRLIFDDMVIIVMNVRDLSKFKNGEEIMQEVAALRNILAYDQHMWNQVSQIIQKNHEFAGMRDLVTLEEVVLMARESLKNALGDGVEGPDQLA
jgi:PAS domain S-box-containing protein